MNAPTHSESRGPEAYEAAPQAGPQHAPDDLQTAENLVGLVFTTPKELRHQAEQNLGQLFVPTEVLSAGEHSADLVLRPEGMGEILVHAERERHWNPYEVTRVDNVER